MEISNLQKLLSLPESETLDFKAKCYNLSNGQHKIAFAKDLASMANTPREEDAHIVLGVKKRLDGSFKLLGVDHQIDDADLQSVAASYLEPVPRFNFQPVRYCDVLLGIVTIPANQQYPVSPRVTRGSSLVEGVIYFRRGSMNASASTVEQKRIWEWFHDRPSFAEFNSLFRGIDLPEHQRIDSDALLLGPVQAFGLTNEVKEAQHVAKSDPAQAALKYEEIAQSLEGRFLGFANRFEKLRAESLRTAGCFDESHDILIKLAVHDLFERAEPQLSADVEQSLRELGTNVDELRSIRANALIHFGQCHEYSGELEKLAECFDKLKPVDEFRLYAATLLAEAAIAAREFPIVLNRQEAMLGLEASGKTKIGLRIRTALGDAGVSNIWPCLINEMESQNFRAYEGTYVCLRGARWYAWNGQLDRAKSLYRLALKMGSEAGLDLDVENALWSLTFLYSLGDSPSEFIEMNRMALSIEGTRSYVMLNSRTRQRAYQYLANGQLPNAHLWAKYRLLEAIRSGCLMDELESHRILARIHTKSEEPLRALEHSILGGEPKLVTEIATQINEWPDFFATTLASKAPWVRRGALEGLKYVGDFAPPKVARRLVSDLMHQYLKCPKDTRAEPSMLDALGAIILDADDDDIVTLIPILGSATIRDPKRYLPTDPGVMKLAARLYRFRPNFRKQAASVLAELAMAPQSSRWSNALNECGDETAELVEALLQVANREKIDLAGPLSDMQHLNKATRGLWYDRLQFVFNHPLRDHSVNTIGPRYDVPAKFLCEQEYPISLQFTTKLIAIGHDYVQPVLNRATALAACADVVDVLSTNDRAGVFSRSLPLAKWPIKISEIDEFHSSTLHPLSRFRMSLGSATDVQAAAGWLMGRAATSYNECNTAKEIALHWVRSNNTLLQDTGARILTLPRITVDSHVSSELATHPNPHVRRKSVWMGDKQSQTYSKLLEQLTKDPDRRVRIAVARAIRTIRSTQPSLHQLIHQRLENDPSAIVRACASEV